MPITRAYGQASQLGNTPAASNPVLNSAFQVWQRGTSISVTGSNTYTADRWTSTAGASANMTISRQTTSDTTNLPNIQYCARVQRNSGQTGTGGQFFYQNFESINSIPFAGKTITFSFYARRGADYSGASNDLKVRLFTGTGTDQNVLVGFTGSVTLISSTAALTTTWQRFSYTGTIATTATQIALGFEYNGVGTAGTNDYFEVTGVQLDIGSVALPFRTYSATLAGELGACRRYLPMISATSTEVATGYSYSTNNAIYQFYFDVPARVAPTGITLSGNFYGYALNTTYAITPVFNGSSQYGATLVSGSGLTITAGQGSRLATNGTATILFTGCEL
jgi:hypothetical protein